jgi:tRNA pseudouridine55 synthase
MPVIVVDKPKGPTSFSVVRSVQRHLRSYCKAGGLGIADASRIGHGGTLDPMATGVLPLCIGESTKIAPFLLDAHKAYEATLELGVQTDTLDAQGQVVARHPVGEISLGRLEEVLTSFRGEISQVPPMHSALKRDGKPLYEYARQGIELERQPRNLTIFELRILEFDPAGRLSIFVHCSKGTYIRVLADDIGRALGPGAHLTALRRTVSGPFTLQNAITLEALEQLCAMGAPLPSVGLTESLAQMPYVILTEHQAFRVGMGQKLPWEDIDPLGTHAKDLLSLLRPDKSLLAVAERNDAGLASLRRVFLREELPIGRASADPVRGVEVQSTPQTEQITQNDTGNVHSNARDS